MKNADFEKAFYELYGNRKLDTFDYRAFGIPHILLGSVRESIQEEVLRVSIISLYLLNIPMDTFVNPPHPALLVDLTAVNENNLYTFPRKNGDSLSVPVIVLSSMPIYESDGTTETIGIYSPENAICFVNLHKRLDQFDLEKSGEEEDIVLDKSVLSSDEQQAGLIAIEEIIHFIQDKYWHRPWGNGTSSEMDIKVHDDDPLEKEAKQLKKLLIRQIYPDLLLN